MGGWVVGPETVEVQCGAELSCPVKSGERVAKQSKEGTCDIN